MLFINFCWFLLIAIYLMLFVSWPVTFPRAIWLSNRSDLVGGDQTGYLPVRHVDYCSKRHQTVPYYTHIVFFWHFLATNCTAYDYKRLKDVRGLFRTELLEQDVIIMGGLCNSSDTPTGEPGCVQLDLVQLCFCCRSSTGRKNHKKIQKRTLP